MYETGDLQEKVILVALDDDNATAPAESCLNELAELVATSGGIAVGQLTQKRDKPHPGHYIGKGKLLDLKDLVALTGADGIVCDDELTSAQQRNMSDALDVKVMDRTMVILDIFAKHARTSEGKAQVELAQLQYNLSHLTGIGRQLSRLGGGIGTRGPGEKKLETDRRHIKARIAELNDELKEIEKHRAVSRGKRQRSAVPVAALVGYTNAGKSTLMNALSGADVLAADKLFATLDATTRKITLPNGSEALLTDTVGFIQKLPHHLIRAFRATLEELCTADMLIHVVDAQSPLCATQMHVTYKTLGTLGCLHKPIVTAYNKMDLEPPRPLPTDAYAKQTVCLSAKNKAGVDQLATAIENELKNIRQKIKMLIPYADGGALYQIYGHCEIVVEEHRDTGTFLELYANEEIVRRFSKHIVN